MGSGGAQCQAGAAEDAPGEAGQEGRRGQRRLSLGLKMEPTSTCRNAEDTGQAATAGLWLLRKFEKVGSRAHVEGLEFEEGALSPIAGASIQLWRLGDSGSYFPVLGGLGRHTPEKHLP